MTKRGPSGIRTITPTILLVDDRYTAIASLRLYLQSDGYRLLAATSGQAALDAFQNARVDLVVLDVVMPVMDGIEVADRLRANPETREVPIIFLTGLPNQVRDRFSGFGDPGVVVLGKPANPELLKIAIERLLSCSPTPAQTGGDRSR